MVVREADEQLVAAIKVVKKEYAHALWSPWATEYVSGRDRTRESAETAAAGTEKVYYKRIADGAPLADLGATAAAVWVAKATYARDPIRKAEHVRRLVRWVRAIRADAKQWEAAAAKIWGPHFANLELESPNPLDAAFFREE